MAKDNQEAIDEAYKRLARDIVNVPQPPQPKAPDPQDRG